MTSNTNNDASLDACEAFLIRAQYPSAQYPYGWYSLESSAKKMVEHALKEIAALKQKLHAVEVDRDIYANSADTVAAAHKVERDSLTADRDFYVTALNTLSASHKVERNNLADKLEAETISAKHWKHVAGTKRKALENLMPEACRKHNLLQDLTTAHSTLQGAAALALDALKLTYQLESKTLPTGISFSDVYNKQLAARAALMKSCHSFPLKINGKYNWKSQPERLVYTGKSGLWHQFSKLGDLDKVWCEVLESDLHMLEETRELR